MPYCTSCGLDVPTEAAFCGHCGKPQPGSARASGGRPAINSYPPIDSITPRTASILCYIPVFGIIPAIIVLASQRFRRDAKVRFNAFQSVYLFVAWLIVSTALPIAQFGIWGGHIEHSLLEMIKLGFFICWIVLLVKASQQQTLHLPIIGDLAARSTTEQM